MVFFETGYQTHCFSFLVPLTCSVFLAHNAQVSFRNFDNYNLIPTYLIDDEKCKTNKLVEHSSDC